ncbi:sulfatase-like hydrolase/transferase [Pelagicoccus mobilis]|uniref:Sulfatase-like hydrolase/transferase n=1 Tax=Pelagicoccus mobilis TaxID=415221 RepID=A0A934RXW3_9BACT|nr:sulfatase-like hydrolase/transferase [Pelagicoccus mobilis]
MDFINRHKDGPFYLFLGHSMPHVPIYASPDFQGTSQRGLYGDVIQELDWSVGEIVKALDKNEILENTLIVFTSDNGPWLVMEDHGGSAGILREGKQFTFEGGQRVPTVASWPNGIAPKTEYNGLALMTDWFKTIAEMGDAPIPQDREYDSESLTSVFQGGKRPGTDEFLYFDGTKLECYRKGDWKIKLAYEGFEGANWKSAVDPHPLLLINLNEDPGETNNLADKHPEKVASMLADMQAYRERLGTFPPDIPIRSPADNSHYKYLQEKRQHSEH